MRFNVFDNATHLQQDNSLTGKKMIENIPAPLVSFAGSGANVFSQDTVDDFTAIGFAHPTCLI
jgi:hypothetical protein